MKTRADHKRLIMHFMYGEVDFMCREHRANWNWCLCDRDEMLRIIVLHNEQYIDGESLAFHLTSTEPWE